MIVRGRGSGLGADDSGSQYVAMVIVASTNIYCYCGYGF